MAQVKAAVDWIARIYSEMPNVVRDVVALVLICGMLYMQWYSDKDGAVPPSLVSAAGLASGYYLTRADSSALMRSVLCVLYIAVFTGFATHKNWMPESLNSQVATVIGILFGRAKSTTGTPVAP